LWICETKGSTNEHVEVFSFLFFADTHLVFLGDIVVIC
jgi:hypothetical protein